jgi:hypothetical protein
MVCATSFDLERHILLGCASGALEGGPALDDTFRMTVARTSTQISVVHLLYALCVLIIESHR